MIQEIFAQASVVLIGLSHLLVFGVGSYLIEIVYLVADSSSVEEV